MENENQAPADSTTTTTVADPSAVETTTETTTEAPASSVEFPAHGSVITGTDGTERIVHDTDDQGNVIGWHKEAVTEGEQ